MTQISEGNKTHYAIFPENYLVVDDIFLFKKKKLSTAQSALGRVLINEIVCENGVVGFCAFGYKCHKTYLFEFLSYFSLFKIALCFRNFKVRFWKATISDKNYQ